MKKLNVKIIGFYLIIVGFIGILFLLFLINLKNTTSILIGLFFLTLLIIQIIGGFGIINKKVNGLYFSLISQLIQIFNFNLFNFKYKYCSGIELTFHLEQFAFNFKLLSEDFSLIFKSNSVDFITINLIPILMIYLINKYYILDLPKTKKI